MFLLQSYYFLVRMLYVLSIFLSVSYTFFTTNMISKENNSQEGCSFLSVYHKIEMNLKSVGFTMYLLKFSSEHV